MCRSAPPTSESLQTPRRGGTPRMFQFVRHKYKLTMIIILKIAPLWNLLNSADFFTAKIQYLTMTDAKKVWMPDTFFRNEKEGRFHNILVPNVYIRIFPNGNVLYSIRWVLEILLR